jgi:Asp-tRNA(Asn)/Glu-tRNA(Gln) amidotransferase A subunit family amidase
MSAVELAAAIRARRLSPVEVTQAVLARIDAINPRVNAYCTVVAERAVAEARAAEAAVVRGDALGVLHGLPMSFKDLTPTAGIRTTMGSRIFEHWVPGRTRSSSTARAGRAPSCSARRTRRSSGARA